MIQSYLVLVIWPFDWVKDRSESERQAVNSWFTNPWSNFLWLSLRIIIYRNKWDPVNMEISTTLKIAAGTHLHVQQVLELPQYFYLLMERPLDHYFQIWSAKLSGNTVQTKNTYPVSSRWQVRSEKAKQG